MENKRIFIGKKVKSIIKVDAKFGIESERFKRISKDDKGTFNTPLKYISFPKPVHFTF